mmetsp:Transcript_18652/g.53637  ORF Transcript_18652/g.53637 Transcript_18652/m.53637 type:complete len:191 (-) Transcript_18652:4-576(-)
MSHRYLPPPQERKERTSNCFRHQRIFHARLLGTEAANDLLGCALGLARKTRPGGRDTPASPGPSPQRRLGHCVCWPAQASTPCTFVISREKCSRLLNKTGPSWQQRWRRQRWRKRSTLGKLRGSVRSRRRKRAGPTGTKKSTSRSSRAHDGEDDEDGDDDERSSDKGGRAKKEGVEPTVPPKVCCNKNDK